MLHYVVDAMGKPLSILIGYSNQIMSLWQSLLTPLIEDCSESGYSHVYGTDAYQLTKSSSAKRHKNTLQP